MKTMHLTIDTLGPIPKKVEKAALDILGARLAKPSSGGVLQTQVYTVERADGDFSDINESIVKLRHMSLRVVSITLTGDGTLAKLVRSFRNS